MPAKRSLAFWASSEADEDHDFAAIGQCLFDELAGLDAGGFVVRADVADALAVGASLSLQINKVWPAIWLRNSVWLAGSIGLTAMPSTPLARRSSRMLCCSAALPLEGMRKSTSTLPSSLAASLQPARAMVQKFAALLETNASLSFFADELTEDWELPPALLSFLLQLVAIAARDSASKRAWVFLIIILAWRFIRGNLPFRQSQIPGTRLKALRVSWEPKRYPPGGAKMGK